MVWLGLHKLQLTGLLVSRTMILAEREWSMGGGGAKFAIKQGATGHVGKGARGAAPTSARSGKSNWSFFSVNSHFCQLETNRQE